MPKYDIIIVGGGHNGLVAACYLAKAQLKTLVLERRDVVGGGAELDNATGPFSSQIIADLGSAFGTDHAGGASAGVVG